MNYLKVLYLLGFFQGLIIAIIIYSKNPRRIQNRLIAGFILIVSLGCMFDGTVMNLQNPFLFWLWNGNQFLIGPLLYLYLVYFNYSGKFRLKSWLHFLPFVFFKAFLFPYIFFDVPFHYSIFSQQLINTLPAIHLFIYTILSWLRIKIVNNELSNYISNNKPFKILWLKAITLLSATGAILVIISKFVTVHSTFTGNVFYSIAYLLAVSAIYILSTNAINYPYLFEHFEILDPADIHINITEHKTPGNKAANKYKRSALSYEDIEQMSKQLTRLMEDEKPYLQADLSLLNLARLMNIPPHHLTQVINVGLTINFYVLINGYRINEARKKLIDRAYAKYTIEAISYECGFNSKSTFNRLFKEYTGITPSVFQHKHLPDTG